MTHCSSNTDTDIFDEISQLNQHAYNEGFREGEEAGQKQAQLQGFQIGKKMSLDISNLCRSVKPGRQERFSAFVINYF